MNASSPDGLTPSENFLANGCPQIFGANRPVENSTVGDEEGEGGGDNEDAKDFDPAHLLGLRVSRDGRLFATITAIRLTIWQTSPAVVLVSISRSLQSLEKYGANVSILLRPDSSVAVVQTQLGFLITYSITTSPVSRVYKQFFGPGQTPRQHVSSRSIISEESTGMPEVNIRFRMVIKIDAGISKALALDTELVVATEKPAAVQCIRWSPNPGESKHNTELLSRMAWIQKQCLVADMIYDKPMNLAIWITSDGKAYAVQRISTIPKAQGMPKRLFHGHSFHAPESAEKRAVVAVINARFSLLGVACASGAILLYDVKDYSGNINLATIIQPPESFPNTGHVTTLSYSPDGYCLFTGYQRGWATWSVYGKSVGSSFSAIQALSESNSEGWLTGIAEGAWISGGAALLLTCPNDDRLWLLEMARSAVTTCFCTANVSRTVLVKNSSLMIYRGYELPAFTTISNDASLWHHIEIPATYSANQRPLRCVVISSDGRYIAIAGRRGLAHYSVSSGRWKTFDSIETENSFIVRGGMCWYQHILIAAVETDECHELRLYSRERGLDRTSLVFSEQLPSSPAVMALSGQDSLLVYTYDNILHHFVVSASSATVTLVQVGQIALNGIIRAPARVRAINWILPDEQLRDGDPSQDVAKASVLFLVDAKLVLLQSSINDEGGRKYDMRIIAKSIEYFELMRDKPFSPDYSEQTPPESPMREDSNLDLRPYRSLKDSLWFFDGEKTHCWMDVEDLIQSIPASNDRGLRETVSISTDFYPTSIILEKAVILGLDADLVQRRDVSFALFRFNIRTQLFLPQLLRRHLTLFDSVSASSLCHEYLSLPYFSHALEILLHTVLDEEVDNPPPTPSSALLPSVLAFLSTFPSYLDILVQCTRKTEIRSWRTLFAHLPPPQALFEESLEKGLLKTAGGYLLVLHTFDENETTSLGQCIRLLQMAKEKDDWELAKELARFLMALDGSGEALRKAVKSMNIGYVEADDELKEKNSTSGKGNEHSHGLGEGSNHAEGLKLQTPSPNGVLIGESVDERNRGALELDDSLEPDIIGLGITGSGDDGNGQINDENDEE